MKESRDGFAPSLHEIRTGRPASSGTLTVGQMGCAPPSGGWPKPKPKPQPDPESEAKRVVVVYGRPKIPANYPPQLQQTLVRRVGDPPTKLPPTDSRAWPQSARKPRSNSA